MATPTWTDRVGKIQIGNFNQVVALTQYLINQGILNVWKTAHGDGDVPRDVPRRDGSGMYGVVLDAPNIVVSPKEGNRSLVLYQINIKSGTLKIYLSPDPSDNSIINYNLTNTKFVFPVDIGLVGLDPTSDKYQQVRTKMNIPGDYSIKQLLVDMSTAQFAVPDQKKSDFGTWSAADYQTDKAGKHLPPAGYVVGQKRDWFKQPDQVQKSFTSLLADLTNSLLAEELNDLGYNATATDLSSTAHPPYFTPTDVRFQTYPWVDPTTKVQADPALTLPGALNYLIYLEMTDNEKPPDANSPDAFLPTSNGNWTDGTNPSTDSPSFFGIMVLGRKNFLEKYFLPKLWKVNRVMIADLTSITPWIHQTHAAFAYEYNFKYTMAVGSGVADVNSPDPDDVKYAFVRGAGPEDGSKYLEAKIDAKYGALPAGALTWYYTSGVKRDNGDESGIWGSKSYMSTDCWTWNRIRMHVVPGTNQFVIAGAANTQLYWEVNPSRLDPNFDKRLTVDTTWKVTFTLTEVSDGGLIIKIDRDGPNVVTDGQIWDYGVTDNGAWIKSLYNYAGNNLDHLLQGLDNSLKGQERFYFPSKGTFFIKDPMINWQGDLLASLEYNGVDNAQHPNDGAASRDGLTLVPSGQYQELQPHVADPPNAH